MPDGSPTHQEEDLALGCAEFLGELFELTGDRRFSRARSALIGKPPGRRQIDDLTELALAWNLLKMGYATSRNQACQIAAEYYPGHSEEATRVRLLRKLGRND